MMRILLLIFIAALFLPAPGIAATVEELQKQIDDMMEEIEYMQGRVDKNERHTALDRIHFSGDLRYKADTLHYRDVTFSPAIQVDFDDFGAKAMGGAFGDPMNPDSPLGRLLAAQPDLAAAFQAGQLQGVLPFVFAPKRTYDISNDIVQTSRLRLNMRAEVWDNVDFSGRLAMYKNFGDSTGVKVFDSWNSFTMDGTNGGNTNGDWLHVERAYFDWKDIGGTHFYLSIGRRPSTYGPPSNIRENELRGGTPLGHLFHLAFDGITIGYHLSEHTGIEGQTVRFCYGQGFESEWGNGELYNEINTDDVHFGGLNIDLLNDGTNLLQVTAFRAADVTDGFKGVIAFPTEFAEFFAPTLFSDLQKFPTFNFVTRVQPSTNIGNIDLAGIGFVREEMNGTKWFVSGAWTRSDPNGKVGMFGGLLSDPIYEAVLNADGTDIIMKPARATDDDTRHGYSIYVGIQIPAPLGKLGLEYNYGSKYWIPFTQAQDDMIASKLATRGHVGEAYYIFDINPRMFIKIGCLYYDYEYTGSGSPVGKPKDVDDVQDGEEYNLLPVIDKAWDAYASVTVKF